MGRSPQIETLEQRQLLSMTLSGHSVTIIGTMWERNTITVGLSPGGASIYADISYPTKKGTFKQTRTFPLSKKITMVNIDGGNRADLITIDQTNGSFPIPTRINTRAGNDTVFGGDEPDRIQCGSGNCSITSGGGTDTLLGGRGQDTLVGGSGNDDFRANSAGNTLIGGNGDNNFTDPIGRNTIQGGTGHDTYVLVNISLDPDNNYNAAKDTLKKYIPPKKPNELLSNILNTLLNSYLL